MGKIIIVIIVLVAGGVFLFSGKNNHKAEAPTVPQMKTETGKGVSVPSGQATQEIIVEANNWYFVPEEIKVKQGMKVKIILRGVSGTHTFAIPELGVKSEAVGLGETTTVEFVADKRGEFAFKCALFCGEGHQGMIGKFIVE